MKRNLSAFWYFAALAVIYLVLSLVLPANHAAQQEYALSTSSYHLLLLIIELPLLAVWFIAFNGYARLADYAKAIKKTPEGEDFRLMANGARWIAWGFPIPSIISLVLDSIANMHPHFHPAALVIANYINLVILLVAFSLISKASRSLAYRSNLHLSNRAVKLLTMIFVVLGVAFCFFAFRHFNLNYITDAANPYYLPAWIATVTLVVPYLYTWFIGLLAAYEILLVARYTSGILYRRGLQLLVVGLVTIVGMSTALEYIRTLVPRTGHMALGFILIVVYVFEIGSAIGYLLLALGAKRLKRIEEV